VNLLLDTHIWLWSHAEPERLTKRVAAALADDSNQLWRSPISIWEFLLLTERGRVRARRNAAGRLGGGGAVARTHARCAAQPRGRGAQPIGARRSRGSR